MSMKRASAVAASAVLLGSLATMSAGPASASVAGSCVMDIDSITATGDVTSVRVTSTTPPSADPPGSSTHLFGPGAAKASSTWFNSMGVAYGMSYSGYVVLGSALYYASFGTEDGTQKPFQKLTRVGGGWGTFTAIEESVYQQYVGGPVKRVAFYGLRNDGVLLRWNTAGGTFKANGSYPGFSAVKTMALISQTDTYDTFLATTRGGALYTIRIPSTSPMKPIVKQVRVSTWQGFESLVATKCGKQSTMLTAIDRDTGFAYVYAVGHATGTTTVIQFLGKVPVKMSNPINYLDTPDTSEHLFGE